MQEFALSALVSGGPQPIDTIEDYLLETAYDKVTKKTLRSNLQTLAHHDLVEIGEHDGRAHEYCITERGRRVMQAKKGFLDQQFSDDGGDA